MASYGTYSTARYILVYMWRDKGSASRWCIAQVKLTAMQGPSPGRVFGKLISYNDELYMLGGFPTKYHFNPNGIATDDWIKKEGFLMRLDRKTNEWQSEGDAELPQQTWKHKQYLTVTGQRHSLPLSLPCS